MPIYEYKCQQCGLHFEKRQSVSDEPLTTCEKCHGKLEKQWSLSGFQFKGAGWYVTDYAGKKSSSSESTAAGETASKPKDDTGTASAETAKPAVKPETASKPAKE
jgi:putative FmdB family regulatory protein